MAYTTITAATIGLADGDQSPAPVDGTIRITPRFPSAASTSGVIATGPVIVAVTGGAMPKTDIPALSDATALVEFHLYDRNAGPVNMPSTEIPLEPSTTISLSDYLAAAVDPATGAKLIRGPRGRGVTSVSGSGGNIVIEWEDGAESTSIPMPDAIEGPRGIKGDKGDPGNVRLEGVSPSITVGTESVQIGDVEVPTFSAAVHGVGIRRMLASKNVEEPMDDGDILIVLDTPQYFTDFTLGAAGEQPSGWSKQWEDGEWIVAYSEDATGGKSLQQTASGTGRRVLAWDDLAEDAAQYPDVEIVFKWRGIAARSVVRGSGADGNETGFAAGRNDSNEMIQLFEYVNGSAGFVGSEPEEEHLLDRWYITRFRAHGSYLVTRTWEAGSPEPSIWLAERDRDTITDGGFIGVLGWGPGISEYDWFGAAFDGGRAPKGD